MVEAGDNLAMLVADCLAAQGITLQDGDVIVFAQKVISKTEGCLVDLKTVVPSARALALSQDADNKDPRLVELILSESNSIVRQSGGLIPLSVILNW